MPGRRKKDQLYQEARNILLNHLELDENGRFRTVDEVRFALWGAADGESKIRFLGLSTNTYYYSGGGDNTQAIYKVDKAMATMGRGVTIKADRENACCIMKTYVFYPVVLIFYEDDEEDLCLTVYTPRAIFSVFAKMIAVRKFNRTMEGQLTPSGEQGSLLDRIKESRHRRKTEKANRKAEKKKGKEEDTDDDDYESIFDMDWSSPDDEITEDDLIPEDEMPKEEEETSEES